MLCSIGYGKAKNCFNDFIAIVCAQHEHEHTLVKALEKFLKYKYFWENKLKGAIKYFQRM